MITIENDFRSNWMFRDGYFGTEPPVMVPLFVLIEMRQLIKGKPYTPGVARAVATGSNQFMIETSEGVTISLREFLPHAVVVAWRFDTINERSQHGLSKEAEGTA